jgi:diguanylate cyclase (GGDEF)-like protein
VPVSVALLDLDGFKPINDTYGHAAGDELLIATARKLQEELRTSDFVFRLGGDEFLVVLPDTDLTAARIVAGKLVDSMRRLTLAGRAGRPVPLRGSIGLASSEATPWGSAADLLAAADRALYAAKQAGGDGFAVDEDLVLD